jgi:plastocyanin
LIKLSGNHTKRAILKSSKNRDIKLNDMKKILFLLFLLSISIAGSCKKWVITTTTSSFTFSPSTVTITLGDSVNFSLGSIHNAVEVSKTTWDTNKTTPLPGFSVPLGGGLVLPAQLNVGTHYYVCTPHASSGMKGMIVVQSSTGLENTELQSDISAYPNPSNGKFQLIVDGSKPADNYDVEIYSLQGEIVYHQFTNKKTGIDLSNQPKGIYFARIYNKQKIRSIKLVIK